MTPPHRLLLHLLYVGTCLVARAADTPPNSFDVVDVAPGILAFVSPATTSGVINGNSVAIVGDDGALVVDSGQFPLTTRRMIAEIRLLITVRDQAQSAVAKGLTLDAARQQVDLGDVRRDITGGDALREGAFDAFFLDPAFRQAYTEAKGEPLVE